MSRKKKNDLYGHLDLSTSPNFYRENKIKNNVINNNNRRDRNIFCGNCGNLGHTYRRCKFPIMANR